MEVDNIDTSSEDRWSEEEDFSTGYKAWLEKTKHDRPPQVQAEPEPPIPDVVVTSEQEKRDREAEEAWEWGPGAGVQVRRSPNKSGAGMKRLSDGPIDQEDVDTQPAAKLLCVDDDAAPHILDKDGFLIQNDDGDGDSMDTAVPGDGDGDSMDTAVPGNAEPEPEPATFLTVPNFERTPAGSPKKTAVRRFSNSPGTSQSQFTGNNFDLSPRKLE